MLDCLPLCRLLPWWSWPAPAPPYQWCWNCWLWNCVLFVVCVYGWERVVWGALCTSLQCSWCSWYVFLTTGNVPTLVTVYYSTLLVLGVLVLWLHEELFDCSIALDVCWYTIVTTNLLKTFCYTLCVRDDHKSYAGFLPCQGTSSVLALGLLVSFSVLVLSLLELAWSMLALGLELLSCRLLMLMLSFWLLLMYLLCTLFMAQCGYLHLTRASLRCYNSFWKSPGLVQTVLALCVSVPMTLYLADRLWWLFHCRYWSVWVHL